VIVGRKRVISRKKREAWEKERSGWVEKIKNKKRKVMVGIRVCRFLFFIVSRTYNGIINWALRN
jgi:hypothetical protein